MITIIGLIIIFVSCFWCIIDLYGKFRKSGEDYNDLVSLVRGNQELNYELYLSIVRMPLIEKEQAKERIKHLKERISDEELLIKKINKGE